MQHWLDQAFDNDGVNFTWRQWYDRYGRHVVLAAIVVAAFVGLFLLVPMALSAGPNLQHPSSWR